MICAGTAFSRAVENRDKERFLSFVNTSFKPVFAQGSRTLGVKTSLKALADVGPAPVGVMLIQTVFLAVIVIGGIAFIR